MAIEFVVAARVDSLSVSESKAAWFGGRDH